MTQSDFTLIGKGLYSPREAARLSGVSLRSIERWTRGYTFKHRGKLRHMDPVIGASVEHIGDAPVLTFADLMEVRFLNAFREMHLSWSAIRLAVIHAREVFGTTHPFSSNRFKTDGRTILGEVVDEAGDRHLLNLVHNQWEMQRVVLDCLREGLHYEDQQHPLWWSPLGNRRTVVLHPGRAFGAPIVDPSSIRTSILFNALKAEGSHRAVASWYRIEESAVRDAEEFEIGLRRAA